MIEELPIEKENCYECNGTEFEVKEVTQEVTVKGEEFKIEMNLPQCSNCGWPLMSGEDMDVFRRLAADAYRDKHGLLNSSKIKGYREMVRMTQQEFAEYLKVRIDDIRRWETYFIQDDSMNELIRVKCNYWHALFNVKILGAFLDNNFEKDSEELNG